MIKGKYNKFLSLKYVKTEKEADKIIKIKKIKPLERINFRSEFKNYLNDQQKFKT
jgi:hypothetical protein